MVYESAYRIPAGEVTRVLDLIPVTWNRIYAILYPNEELRPKIDQIALFVDMQEIHMQGGHAINMSNTDTYDMLVKGQIKPSMIENHFRRQDSDTDFQQELDDLKAMLVLGYEIRHFGAEVGTYLPVDIKQGAMYFTPRAILNVQEKGFLPHYFVNNLEEGDFFAHLRFLPANDGKESDLTEVVDRITRFGFERIPMPYEIHEFDE